MLGHLFERNAPGGGKCLSGRLGEVRLLALQNPRSEHDKEAPRFIAALERWPAMGIDLGDPYARLKWALSKGGTE